LQGLAGATLLVPGGTPFSPFGSPVQLYRYLDQTGALGQSVKSSDARLGLTLNGDLKPWQWSFTGTYDRVETRTATDRGIDTTSLQAALAAGDPAVNPFGSFAPALLGTVLVDRARARSSVFAGDLLLNGPLFRLPAGDVTTSIRIGASRNSFDSRSTRAGLFQSARSPAASSAARQASTCRSPAAARACSRRSGDLALNANVGARHLSDFGTPTTLGYGVRWTPIPQIRFIGSVSTDRVAPTGQQINNPVVITPNVPVFDFAVGDTCSCRRSRRQPGSAGDRSAT
jgi:hypothetical protein